MRNHAAILLLTSQVSVYVHVHPKLHPFILLDMCVKMLLYLLSYGPKLVTFNNQNLIDNQ